MTVSVIIPAKNEEKNIVNLLNNIPDKIEEIIVIDGNSIDLTYEFAHKSSRRVKVIRQKSKGKGAALSLGFQIATGDYLIAIDADGSNDPKEIKEFIEKLNEGFDLVKGSRYLAEGGSDDITKFRSIGNLFLTYLANTLFDANWTDLAYGYVGMTKTLADRIKILNFDSESNSTNYGKGFEIEALICCRAKKFGANIAEIPSFEKKRVYGSSNLKSIPDGLRALGAILFEKFVFRN